MIFEKLGKYVRQPVCVTGFSSRLSIHEAIKAQLYVLGYRLHYLPILEATTDTTTLNRIDCIYVKNIAIICAIEIDYSIKRKSIDKLLKLSPGVEKIIISYGRRESAWRAVSRHRNSLSEIKHYILNW